jgi:hypothetical protein
MAMAALVERPLRETLGIPQVFYPSLLSGATASGVTLIGSGFSYIIDL